MKRLSSAHWIYIGLHAAIPVFFFAAPLLRLLAGKLPSFLTGCLLHNFFHLYCPLCGGTRAVEALTQGEVLVAWHYNAAVMIFLCGLLVYDAVCLIRMLLGKAGWWSLPQKSWIFVAALFLGYAVLRNLLMIVWGIDPVGDLAWYWH